MQVLYTAAHGGFETLSKGIPLGGGAAVSERLVEEWSRTKPFSLRLITPSILGAAAPGGSELASFGERAYAKFCYAFERAVTEEILRYDPASTVVLANDVSEGPDFARLAASGFAVFTIYHVDVVAYVSAIYLRGMIRPETTVRWYRRLHPILPAMAGLIWAKQEASVRHSRGLIVPSEGMRDVLLSCYPEAAPEKIHVLPWGSFDDSQATHEEVHALRAEFGVPNDALVLLTLSRISPEKGQDLLLEALIDWERRDDFPTRPLWLFICGEAAFMQGERFLNRLRSLARRLQRTRVIFPGYAAGARKRAFFGLADLYVFPSRHESYGLTLMEALAAGVPAVCLDHHGARSVMRREFGEMVARTHLRDALKHMLSDGDRRRRRGEAAQAYAKTLRFPDQAAELARMIVRNI